MNNVRFLFLVSSFMVSALVANADKGSNSTDKVSQKDKPKNVESSMPAPKAPKVNKNEIAIFKDYKYEVVKMKLVDGVEISEKCDVAKKTKCIALNKMRLKAKFPNISGDPISHPAAAYCAELGGESLVGVISGGNEKDICRFKDKSFFSSWGAFYKHFPVEVIK